MRQKVWELSCQSAGLSIRFKTNAQDISVRYEVTQPLNMPHMPSTGVSGVDLYRYEDMAFCFGTYSFGDTILYKYRVDRGVQVGKDTEYILYLPLYNEVSHFEIGVPEGSSFSFVPAVKGCPIVLYGTSIAQGACASRPAMAWANIVGRKLERPLINLGFSGNGKLEGEIRELICEQYPSIVILDCMPNVVAIDSDEIIRRMKDAVHRISKVPNVAILVVEHAGNSNALTHQAQGERAECTLQSSAARGLFVAPEGRSEESLLPLQRGARLDSRCLDRLCASFGLWYDAVCLCHDQENQEHHRKERVGGYNSTLCKAKNGI